MTHIPPHIGVKLLLLTDQNADYRHIESRLHADMRLPWSLMHCETLHSATIRIKKADLVILDLDLIALLTPKEIFDQVTLMTPDIPIIVLTGKGEEEHKLATIVMEAGAADVIIRGKFERLVDAIEFALIRQKLVNAHQQRHDKKIEIGKEQNLLNKTALSDQTENSRQLLSMLMGSYSLDATQ